MTREDEYTLTLTSGKIVMLISSLLCAMLACFVTGLVIGRSPQLGATYPQLDVAGPISTPGPELSRAEQPVPKVSLPEVSASATPREPAATAPPKEETRAVAEKTEPAPAPRPAPAPSVSTSGPTYTICVLSARNKNGAESYARELRESGYKASVMQTKTSSGSVWYRTVIGQYSAREAAERQLVELRKKSTFADAFIILK
jgi:cell division septation protein DedD